MTITVFKMLIIRIPKNRYDIDNGLRSKGLVSIAVRRFNASIINLQYDTNLIEVFLVFAN